MLCGPTSWTGPGVGRRTWDEAEGNLGGETVPTKASATTTGSPGLGWPLRAVPCGAGAGAHTRPRSVIEGRSAQSQEATWVEAHFYGYSNPKESCSYKGSASSFLKGDLGSVSQSPPAPSDGPCSLGSRAPNLKSSTDTSDRRGPACVSASQLPGGRDIPLPGVSTSELSVPYPLPKHRLGAR